MRKITYAICLINFLVFAQPVLNVSDINPLNISQNSYSASSSIITAGAAGANQTWDFSSLTLTNQGSSSANSVLGAPYSNNFQASNFFVNTNSSEDNSYGYYNLTANKLEILGESNSTGIILNYTNPETLFVFPFSFNSAFNDTYQITQSQSVNSKVTTYDAYGTVITAYGTFNDVIRLKTIVNNSDIYYNWFKTNPYVGIVDARAYVNSGNTVYFSFQQNTNLITIQNQTKSKFSIYPNPTEGDFTIDYNSFSNEEIFVNVYDILGNQIIKNEKFESNSKYIFSSDFASGLYFIKITDASNSVLFSDKIIKK